MFPTDSSPAIQKNFFEKIRNFPPCDILQMCCLSRRSGEMRFDCEGRSGFIYLDKGEVTHAQLDDFTGEPAAADILSWPPGDFSFRDGASPPQRTLKATWDQMLDASHRLQRSSVPTEAPPGFESLAAPETPAPTAGTRIDPNTQVGRLLIYGENIEGRTFDLNLPASYLGRAPTNEIILREPSVSGRHCVFLLANGRVTVRDLNSSNGTFVNGHPITEVQIEVNDIVRIGTALIRFEIALKRPRLSAESGPVTPRPVGQSSVPPAATGVTRPMLAPPTPKAAPPMAPQAPSMSGPISYDRIARTKHRPRTGPRGGTPTWLIALVALTILMVLYMIIGSQDWAPAWLRLW